MARAVASRHQEPPGRLVSTSHVPCTVQDTGLEVEHHLKRWPVRVATLERRSAALEPIQHALLVLFRWSSCLTDGNARERHATCWSVSAPQHAAHQNQARRSEGVPDDPSRTSMHRAINKQASPWTRGVWFSMMTGICTLKRRMASHACPMANMTTANRTIARWCQAQRQFTHVVTHTPRANDLALRPHLAKPTPGLSPTTQLHQNNVRNTRKPCRHHTAPWLGEGMARKRPR